LIVVKWVLFAAVVLLGCSDAEESPPEDEEPPVECDDLEVTAADGSCHPVGTPPDACGVGFLSDGTGGCVAELPPAPCPPGLMAIPGETTCREIMDCGDGTWGDIPVEPNTVYVDQSFVGTSDGTAAAPYSSIGPALTAAPAGAIVAIAGGNYVEYIFHEDKPLRMWGRCPSMVTLTGTGEVLTLIVGAGCDGFEIHGIAVTGPTNGLAVIGSLDFLIDHVWVHDLPGRGLVIQNDFGPTSGRTLDSLIEFVGDVGLFTGASVHDIERTISRDLGSAPSSVEHNPMTGDRALVSYTSCILERGSVLGLQVGSSDVTMSATLIRDIGPQPDGRFGNGVAVSDEGLGPSTFAIDGSVIERVPYLGILAYQSTVAMVNTSIRDVFPQVADGTFGDGVAVVIDPNPASVSMTNCRIERTARAGVTVFGAPLAMLDSSVGCASFDIDTEIHLGVPAAFDSLGGNACGCEQLEVCKAVSANLAPPPPVP
jgi:hypothetical protein